MKTQGRVKAWLHRSWPRHWMKVNRQLISPAPIIPSEIATGTNWKGRWEGGLRGRSGSCEKHLLPIVRNWTVTDRSQAIPTDLSRLQPTDIKGEMHWQTESTYQTRQAQTRPGKKGRPDRTRQDKSRQKRRDMKIQDQTIQNKADETKQDKARQKS